MNHAMRASTPLFISQTFVGTMGPFREIAPIRLASKWLASTEQPASSTLMDPQKLAYFVSKYRSIREDEFAEVAARVDSLADEAAAALRQVAQERGLSAVEAKPESVRSVASREMSAAERDVQTKLSTDLWNSALSKRVQFQFSAMAIIFATSFLGAQGLRVGGLWVLLFAAGLYYVANRFGRSYTKTLCADADKSVDAKRTALQRTSAMLWPALVVPALLGVMLASALRGA